MSKLTLEQTKKIEHLFPNSQNVILCIGDTTIAEYPSKLADEHPSFEHCEICRDPSLEEMLDYLKEKDHCIVPMNGLFLLYYHFCKTHGGSFITNINNDEYPKVETTWTEAAYKAICIIEGIEL